MTDAGQVTVDIFFREGVSQADGERFGELLVELGLAARVKRLPAVRGPEMLTWIILIALPLNAFLAAIGTKIGEDSWAGIKKAIRTLANKGNPKNRSVATVPLVLQDTSTGIQIVLETDLPDDALDQLLALDFSQFRYGPVHYDRVAKRWRSELDEAKTDREVESA